jgi:TRAP transporter TAXI family solute receptor
MGRAVVRGTLWLSIVLALILAVSRSEAADDRKFHIFASVGTGEMNGIYYPLGGVICSIVNQNLRESGVRCSRETTPGSVYNIDALRTGELEFALVQSDVAYDAFHGTGPYSGAPFPDLRSVVALHPELVTIVARPGIRNLADLAGKRIVAGPVGSGSRHTWDAIVQALGWNESDTPRIVDMPADAIGTALCSGAIDASLFVVGHPSGKVRALLAACPLDLVALDGPAVDSLVIGTPYLRKRPIPGGPYGLAADIPSFGASAILVTTMRLDSRVVSDFAEAVGKQIEPLKSKMPLLENLTAQEMITEKVPAPLHPAAREVYKKLGLLK